MDVAFSFAESFRIHADLILKVTSGGRNLNAVYGNPDFTALETLVMQYLAGRMDFRGLKHGRLFSDTELFASQPTIARACRLSVRTIVNVLSSLHERGYITKTKRTRVNEQGKRVRDCNAYGITTKVFELYAERLQRRAERKLEKHATVKVQDVHLHAVQLRDVHSSSPLPLSSSPSGEISSPLSLNPPDGGLGEKRAFDEDEKWNAIRRYLTATYQPDGLDARSWAFLYETPDGQRDLSGVASRLLARFSFDVVCHTLALLRYDTPCGEGRIVAACEKEQRIRESKHEHLGRGRHRGFEARQ